MTATFSPKTANYTIGDFNTLPEGPPYHEFDNGEIIPLPPPTITHQDILFEVVAAVRSYARARNVGRAFMDVDVHLPDGRVYVPDFGFLSNDKLSMVSPVDGKIHGAPTLVAEITSADETRDRTRKFHVYFDNGVEWLWLVSQSLVIEEYHATEPGYVRVSTTAPGEVFRPQLFPGLEIDLAAILEDTEDAKPDSSEQAG